MPFVPSRRALALSVLAVALATTAGCGVFGRGKDEVTNQLF